MKPFVNIFITSLSNHTAIAEWVDATCAYVLLLTTTFGSYDAEEEEEEEEEEGEHRRCELIYPKEAHVM